MYPSLRLKQYVSTSQEKYFLFFFISELLLFVGGMAHGYNTLSKALPSAMESAVQF